MSKFLPLVLVGVLAAATAQAQAQFPPASTAGPIVPSATVAPVTGAPATLANVVLATIKQGGLDMSSDAAIDDFAKVEYCDIYKKYRDNEFDWRRVRAAMRKKIDLDKPGYPDVLYLEREEKVGQYDFNAGMLLLQSESVLHTRALLLASIDNLHVCNSTLTTFPDKFIAILDKPLNFDGVELSEDEGRSVIASLPVQSNSGNRLAYGRYTIGVTSADPPHATGPMHLSATLNDVTLYQDAQYTTPFWSGQSSVKSYGQKTGAGALDVIPFKGIDPTEEKGLAPKPLATGALPAGK